MLKHWIFLSLFIDILFSEWNSLVIQNQKVGRLTENFIAGYINNESLSNNGNADVRKQPEFCSAVYEPGFTCTSSNGNLFKFVTWIKKVN